MTAPSSRRRVTATLAVLAVLGACHLGESTEALRFVEVSAGQYHTCARTEQGQLYCWGANTFGALGTGDTATRLAPARVAEGRAFAAVAAGFHHTCGLTPDGTAFCWGHNGNGSVGDGSTNDRLVPTAVSGGRRFLSIAAGEAHTCGIAVDHALLCWGAPLGPDVDGNMPPVAKAPTRVADGFAGVDAGYEIACGFTSAGATWCWGQRPPGIALPPGTVAIGVPQPVAGSVSLASLSVGYKHACGLDASGAAFCWGLNSGGQLGDGTRDDRIEPTAVSSTTRWKLVSAHAPAHTCAISTAGDAYCWGGNTYGRLGDGTDTIRLEPAVVVGGTRFVSVSTGFYHTCGVSDQGVVLCWGSGQAGQLGTGETVDRFAPTAVAAPAE